MVWGEWALFMASFSSRIGKELCFSAWTPDEGVGLYVALHY